MEIQAAEKPDTSVCTVQYCMAESVWLLYCTAHGLRPPIHLS